MVFSVMVEAKVHHQFVHHMGCGAEGEAFETFGPMVLFVRLGVSAVDVQRFTAARVRHFFSPCECRYIVAGRKVAQVLSIGVNHVNSPPETGYLAHTDSVHINARARV